jgi:hypothetical protein
MHFAIILNEADTDQFKLVSLKQDNHCTSAFKYLYHTNPKENISSLNDS